MSNKKIPTTWVRTDWRGKFSYEVLNFPFGIGFLNAMRKSVFEPIVVVGIFYKINNIPLK